MLPAFFTMFDLFPQASLPIHYALSFPAFWVSPTFPVRFADSAWLKHIPCLKFLSLGLSSSHPLFSPWVISFPSMPSTVLLHGWCQKSNLCSLDFSSKHQTYFSISLLFFFWLAYQYFRLNLFKPCPCLQTILEFMPSQAGNLSYLWLFPVPYSLLPGVCQVLMILFLKAFWNQCFLSLLQC